MNTRKIKYTVFHRVIPTKSQNHINKELYRNFDIERSSNFTKKLRRGYKIADIFQHAPFVLIQDYIPVTL